MIVNRRFPLFVLLLVVCYCLRSVSTEEKSRLYDAHASTFHFPCFYRDSSTPTPPKPGNTEKILISDIFMEDNTVGGMPCFTWTIRNWLPKNKKKRRLAYSIQMFIFTYVTYSLFCMARRPISVVKTKIIEECTGNNSNVPQSKNVTWCNEDFILSSTEEALGLMDLLYICSYGVCLFMSGVVADCYNPRFYLTAGCLLSGFFCALLGLSDYWEIRSFKFLGTVLVLFGASQSMAWPVVLSCVTHWYSGRKRGMFFGFWNTHNYLGSVLGIFIALTWVDKHWRWSFFVPGFILAFMGIVVFIYMVVDPHDLRDLDKVKSSGSKRRLTGVEIPPWLSSNASIKMYDALTLPGVIEFSSCMFFSRMVGYIFLFWLPVFISRATKITAQDSAYYSLAYVVGGSIGGILAGILVDLFRRSAIVCASFLLVSIPILFLFGQISELGKSFSIDFLMIMLTGIFVEAPYVVISTVVSAELGTHKMIKRNHRALSTIGGIIEGTGAVGASIGTFVCGIIMMKTKWIYILYMMMGLQFIAILCLGKQAYKDFFKKKKVRTLRDYWKAPSF